MTSLLDIGPLTEKVTVNGKQVDVGGVTPEGLFYLLHKFPALQELMSKKGVDAQMLLEVGPVSTSYAIAVATTFRSDYDDSRKWLADVERAAHIAMGYGADYQRKLFQAAINMTFPDGIGPFMRGVEALTDSIKRVTGTTVPVTTSSKPSRSGFTTDSRGMKLGRGAPRANSMH